MWHRQFRISQPLRKVGFGGNYVSKSRCPQNRSNILPTPSLMSSVLFIAVPPCVMPLNVIQKGRQFRRVTCYWGAACCATRAGSWGWCWIRVRTRRLSWAPWRWRRIMLLVVVFYVYGICMNPFMCIVYVWYAAMGAICILRRRTRLIFLRTFVYYDKSAHLHRDYSQNVGPGLYGIAVDQRGIIPPLVLAVYGSVNARTVVGPFWGGLISSVRIGFRLKKWVGF